MSSFRFFIFLLYLIIALPFSASSAEYRLGYLKHDLKYFGNGKEEGGYDINLEYLDFLPSFDNIYQLAGASLSIDGGTDYLYYGAGYRKNFTNNLYGQIDLSLTYHTDRHSKCSFLPRESLALGFKTDKNYFVELFLDHTSDAFICEPNKSIEPGGVRFAVEF